MYFNDLWIMILESISQLLAIPGAALQRLAAAIRGPYKNPENEQMCNFFLGFGTVIAAVAFSIISLTWFFSKPAATADAKLVERVAQLEAENKTLKAEAAVAPVLPTTISSGTVLSPTAIAVASPTPIEFKLDLVGSIQEEIEGLKEEISETEAELKAAKEKPADAEREVSEIQSDLKSLRAELTRSEKALKTAQKATK